MSDIVNGQNPVGRHPAEWHPELDELQRCADGEVGPGHDAALAAHVESCAACRAEVAEMRRATALLCLSSAPPADLFERIKARRDGGERVLLPRVPLSEEREHVDEAARNAAQLAHPMDRMRRATALPRWHRGRAWRWAAAPLAAAATLLLVVRLTAPGPAPDRVRGVGGLVDSFAVGDSAAADSAGVGRTDSASAVGGADIGPLVSLDTTQQGIVVRLAASATFPNPQQARALDAVVSALGQDPARRAVIRYVDPSFNHGSESWRLATRAADRLALGGIEPERVRLVRVQAVNKAGLPPQREAVEVVVNGP